MPEQLALAQQVQHAPVIDECNSPSAHDPHFDRGSLALFEDSRASGEGDAVAPEASAMPLSSRVQARVAA